VRNSTLRTRTLEPSAVLFHAEEFRDSGWSKTCHALASSLPVTLIRNSLILTLTLVLLVLRCQSVPGSVWPTSSHDGVVTNELEFQDAHTNWMCQLEKEH
jgi:hypothetical protein